MSGSRLWTLVRLDLTQRVRSVAWYVMLGVFAAILVVVTALSLLSFSYAGGAGAGAGVYSVVVFVVLLLAVLVSPTLSGNAINGDRDAANLAPVQVTLATTAEIVLAKFVAAWLTGLSFAVIAVPFMLVAAVSGGVDPLVVFVSLVVLIVEIAIIAAIGVGLSGILARPLFSVAVTYLVVAALVIGTPIAFTLGGAAVRTEVTQSYRSYVYDESGMTANPPECGPWETTTYEVPRFDTVWWILRPIPSSSSPMRHRRASTRAGTRKTSSGTSPTSCAALRSRPSQSASRGMTAPGCRSLSSSSHPSSSTTRRHRAGSWGLPCSPCWQRRCCGGAGRAPEPRHARCRPARASPDSNSQ